MVLHGAAVTQVSSHWRLPVPHFRLLLLVVVVVVVVVVAVVVILVAIQFAAIRVAGTSASSRIRHWQGDAVLWKSASCS